MAWRGNVAGREVETARELGNINFDNLAGEVSEAGGHAIWWGVLAAQAFSELRRAEARLRVIEAEVDQEARGTAFRNTPKVTEAMVQAIVTQDERVIGAREEKIQAEERESVMRTMRTVMEQRQRTLNSLAGMVSQEIGARSERPPREPTADRHGHVPRTPVPGGVRK